MELGNNGDDPGLWHQGEGVNEGEFSFEEGRGSLNVRSSDMPHVHDGNVVVMIPTGNDSAYAQSVPHSTLGSLTSPSLLDVLASHLRNFLHALQRLKDVLYCPDPAGFSEDSTRDDIANDNHSAWAEVDANSTGGKSEETVSNCHPWTTAIQDRLKDLLHTLTALFEASSANNSIQHENHLSGSIHPLLNVSSTLQAAQALVTSAIPDPGSESSDAVQAGALQLYQAAENIALALSSSISQYLMAECLAGTGSSFCQSPLEMAGYPNHHQNHSSGRNDEAEERAKSVEDLTTLVSHAVHGENSHNDHLGDGFHEYDVPTGEEVDQILANLKNGVKYGLDRAKRWSKYCRDILNYIEKRAGLELDYGKRLCQLASSTKTSIAGIGGDDSESGHLGGSDPFLPFKDVYSKAFHQDIDHGTTLQATANLLQTYKFVEPLANRRLTHDRMRKDIKEAWTREVKRMADADANLRKARSSYVTRQQEYERARERGREGADIGAEKAEKRKRAEEEAMYKALESETNYKQCVSEANKRQEELIKVKHEVLLKLRELMLQCDQTMKAVTVTYYQLMHTVRDPVPQQLHILAEASRGYVPGHQYKAYVAQKATSTKPHMEENLKPYYFIPYTSTGSVISGPIPLDHNSAKRPGSGQTNENDMSNRSPQFSHLESNRPPAGPLNSWPGTGNSGSPPAFKSFLGRSPGNSLNGSPRDAAGHLAGGGTHEVLDTEGSASVSGGSTRSLDQGNQTTPLTLRRGAAVGNTRANRVEKVPRSGSGNGPPEPPTSNRHRGSSTGLAMSDNAKTHSFHRLRTPSKCRDCDKHLFLQGVECERCGLAAHKKCLTSKRLPACAGQKDQLQRRLTTFGVDISFHVTLSASLVPPIVRRCIAEIDRRGNTTRGIYRVSAVKSKVEELCHQFERDQEGTVLSDYPPQVIANTLKLYFRQLPEPLLTHRLHHEFIRVSREDLQLRDEAKAVKELTDIVDRLQPANFTTAKILMHHLHRVTENSASNQMPASNLGIVFGPTLLKPSEDMASLSILMDTPHQARAVELLIVHVDEIFGPEEQIPGQGGAGDPPKPPKRSLSRRGRKHGGNTMGDGSDAYDSSDADTDDEDDDDDYDEAEDYDDDEEEERSISPRLPARSRVTSGGSNDFAAEVLAAGQRVVADDETRQEGRLPQGRLPTPPAIPAHGICRETEQPKEDSPKEGPPTLLALAQTTPPTLNLQQLPLQKVSPQTKASPSPPPNSLKIFPTDSKSSDKSDEKQEILPASISSDSVASHSTAARGDSPSSQCSSGGKTSLSPLDQSMALLSQPPSTFGNSKIKRPISLSRQRSVSPIRSQDRFQSPSRLPTRIPLLTPEDGDWSCQPISQSGLNLQYQPKMNQGLFKSALGSASSSTSVPSRALGFVTQTAKSFEEEASYSAPEGQSSHENPDHDGGTSSNNPSPTNDREPRFV